MAHPRSVRSRIGRLLVGTAVLAPAIAVAIFIARSRQAHVHLQQQQLLMWSSLDALLLGMGLLLGKDSL